MEHIMRRIGRSLTLFRISFRVLREHRGLIAFPLVSLLASMIILAGFAGPVFGLIAHGGSPGPAGYVILACGYLVLSCVTQFCNAALIHSASVALSGGTPSFRDGFAAAAGRKGAVLTWGAFSGTVSLLMRAAEQRLGPLGRIFAALGGLAWNMVAFMVLPVIVLDGIGVKDAVRRSSELLRRTWGQQLGAVIGIGAGAFLLSVPSFVLFILLAAVAGTAGAIAGLVVCGLWVLAVVLLAGALSGVYQTALYRFATDGVPPAAFAAADLPNAIRPRRRWR
jgi:Family of unknown function (DUF6159)